MFIHVSKQISTRICIDNSIKRYYKAFRVLGEDLA